MNIARILSSLETYFDWNLQQFDVKNVFLHGEIDEKIYVEVPPSFGGSSDKNKVCRLKEALYGLKHYPRA